MKVNRKYLRIFLIFFILFGIYQLIELLTLKDPNVPQVALIGTSLLIGTVIAIAGYVLYKAR
jgi:hypothetical protein